MGDADRFRTQRREKGESESEDCVAEMDRHFPVNTFRFTWRQPGGITTAQATVARELHVCCRETA